MNSALLNINMDVSDYNSALLLYFWNQCVPIGSLFKQNMYNSIGVTFRNNRLILNYIVLFLWGELINQNQSGLYNSVVIGRAKFNGNDKILDSEMTNLVELSVFSLFNATLHLPLYTISSSSTSNAGLQRHLKSLPIPCSKHNRKSSSYHSLCRT